jgi:hypothetical protein
VEGSIIKALTPAVSSKPSPQPSTLGERTALSIANARKLSRSDARIRSFCLLQPNAYLAKSPETRHALLKEAAELLLLSSMQDIVRSEWLEHKQSTPNMNIGYGVRFDKVFNAANDAGAISITIPKQALAQLQIGIAVQVSKGLQPVVSKPLGVVELPMDITPT